MGDSILVSFNDSGASSSTIVIRQLVCNGTSYSSGYQFPSDWQFILFHIQSQSRFYAYDWSGTIVNSAIIPIMNGSWTKLSIGGIPYSKSGSTISDEEFLYRTSVSSNSIRMGRSSGSYTPWTYAAISDYCPGIMYAI